MKKVTYQIFNLLMIIFIISSSIYAQSYTEIISNGWGKGMQSSKPVFTDIDDDGLQDLLIGDNLYGTIFHYEQSSPGATTFVFISYNFNNIAVGFNAAPAFTDLDDDGLLDLIVGEFEGNLNHYEQASARSETFNLVTENFSSIDIGYGSTPTFTNLDNDGLLDLIIGDQNGTIHYYEQADSASALFDRITDTFNYIDVGNESAPTFTDLDNDGGLDLIIGASSGTISYYRQEAGDDTAFQLVYDNFMGIDVGNMASPTFIDLNNDNELDLFIGESDGHINYYIQANPGDTVFNLASENHFHSIDPGYRSVPVFADLDNNGRLDLLVGEFDGNINLYEQSVSDPAVFTLVTEAFNIIDVGNYSSPAFTDIDNDGFLDLLIGEQDGNINHYEQDGYGSKIFTLRTNNFSSIDVGNYATPAVADIDNNGLLDLLIGEQDGNINYYEQEFSGSETFIHVDDNFNSIDVGTFSSPVFTDLDNDGLLDLLTGRNYTSISHYEQSSLGSETFNLVTQDFGGINSIHNAAVAFADYNGDGWTDIFIGGYSGGIALFQRNTGTISTGSASNILSTSATLSGNINPAGMQMNVVFEHGTTISYGDTLVAEPAVVNGNDDITVTFDISGLTANQLYHFRVAAYNGNVVLTGADQIYTTGPASPELVAPTNYLLGVAVDLTLEWNDVSGATSYQLQLSENASFSSTVLDSSGITSTSLDISGLQNYRRYFWRVNASNANGTSDWSAVWNFTTIIGPPALSSPPYGATGILINPTSLIWNEVSGATSYQLQLSENASFSSTVLDSSGITSTSLDISGLQNSTRYYWQVNASNANGTSVWSDTWYFTTVVAAPTAPTLSTPNDGATGISLSPTLSWNTVSEANSYQLQLAENTSFSPTIFDSSGIASTSLQIPELEATTQYYWHVNASNAGGTSDWSGYRSFTTAEITAPPSVPILISPSNNARGIPTQITLSWNTVANADNYNLQVSESQDFTTTIVSESNITGTSYTISDLNFFTTYYWRVAASNTIGTGSWCNRWTFTTMLDAPELVFPEQDAIHISLHPILSWLAYKNDAISYHLQVSGDSPSFSADFVTVNYTSGMQYITYQLTGLEENRVFYWRVRCSGTFPDTSKWSEVRNFTIITYPDQIAISHIFPFPQAPASGSYQKSDFRIIGIPGNSNILLKDILGGTPDQDWQAFWDNGAEQNYFIKYDVTNIFQCSAGKAFWVLHKGPLTIDRTNIPTPDWTEGDVEISLDHEGWNLITNPLVVPKPWIEICAYNELPLQTNLWQYEGTFSGADTLYPYSGYYFYNYNVNTQSILTGLKIPVGRTLAISTLQKPVNKLNWQVDLTLKAGKNIDVSTSFGIADKALINYDQYDYHKPRSMDDEYNIYFKQTAPDKKVHIYARDVRPPINKIEKWVFEVSVSLKQDAELIFNDIINIPEELSVYLVDKAYARAINLREDNYYNFKSVMSIMPFCVLVGDESVVQDEIKKILPAEFALGQNYPNPFNPETIIPLSLPERSRITLNIYNILGQKVKTLFNDVLDAGKHYIIYNGTDREGRKLSSGVYIIRMITGKGNSFARKITLIK